MNLTEAPTERHWWEHHVGPTLTPRTAYSILSHPVSSFQHVTLDLVVVFDNDERYVTGRLEYNGYVVSEPLGIVPAKDMAIAVLGAKAVSETQI